MISYQKTALLNTDFLTAQSFVFQRTLSDKAGEFEMNLLITISAEGEGAFDLVREVGGEAEAVFFDCEETTAQCLVDVLRFVKEKLVSLEKLSVITAAIQEDIFYLCSLGAGISLIARGGRLISVHKAELISGHLQEGDRVLLSTPTAGVDRLLQVPLNQVQEYVEEYARNLSTQDPLALIQLDYNAPQVSDSFVNLQGQTKGEKNSLRKQITGFLRKSPLLDNHTQALGRASRFLSSPKRLPRLTKRRLIVVGILGLMVAVGSWWFTTQNGAQQRESHYYYAQAEQAYAQAQSLKDLNTQEASDKLDVAAQHLEKALAADHKNAKVPGLQEQITRARKEILHEYEVSDLQPFLKLELIKTGFSATTLNLDGNRVAMLDPKEKTFVTVDLKNKSNQILAGKEQLGDARDVDISGSFGYVYSQDKGVLRVDLGSSKVLPVIPPDPDIKEFGAIRSFGTNLYIEDRLANAIWKHTPVQSGYAPKVAYLSDGVQVDLFDTIKTQIDGAFWILLKGNKFLRFVSGSPENFSPPQLINDTADLKSFFVSDSTDNIYFLDNGNSRVVVFKKSGEYLYLLTGEKFKTAVDLVVNEQEKKLYLLEGNALYQVDLR